MQPQPLFGCVPDPLFDERVDLGHGGGDVGLTVAGPDQFQRRQDRQPEPRSLQARDPGRNHRAIVPQGQFRQRRRGHHVAAEKLHRNAVIHLLVHQHGEMIATLEGLQQQPGAGGAFWNQRPLDGGAAVLVKPFHQQLQLLAIVLV